MISKKGIMVKRKEKKTLIQEKAQSVELPRQAKEEDPSPEAEALTRPHIFSLPIFKWQIFLGVFILCSIAFFHWICTSDLFKIPQDVADTRKEFLLSKDRYKKSRDYWDAKQNHFFENLKKDFNLREEHELELLFQDVAPEIIISFIVDQLKVDLEKVGHVAAFPKRETSHLTLIISKYEPGIWPFKIMLSLEIAIKINGKKLWLEIARMRRGSHDIAVNLCWAYFGAELESLKQFGLVPTGTAFVKDSVVHSSP